MPRSSSVDAFKRSLNERLQQFRIDLDSVINVFAEKSHGEQRMGPLRKMVESARDLHDYLADQDRPHWLRSIYASGREYLQKQNPKTARDFLNVLLKHHRDVQEIIFDDIEAIVNFDELFMKYRDDGKLQELFDEMVEALNQIILTGQIDSATVLDTLREMIELLRSGRDGSYLTTKSTIRTTQFLKNLIAVSLEEIPGVKQLLQAYDRTAEQAETELANVETAIRDETLSVLIQRMQRLEQLPNFAQARVKFKESLALTGSSVVIEGEIIDDE